MSEINNFAKLSINAEKLVEKTGQTKQTTKQSTPEETELKANDDKEISIKESQHNSSTNLSFVDSKQEPAIFALGFSIYSAGETKQMLNIGFNLASKLGNDAVSGNKISIHNEPVTSILMNFVVFVARVPVQNHGNHEERKHVLTGSVNTFKKMNNDNTGIDDYSEKEKQFLWKTASIKVQKNYEGNVDYLYYESPEGQPKKLSKQELVDIFSHVLNIVNDESLLNTAIEMGKKLDQQIAAAREESSHEQNPVNEIKSTQTGAKEEYQNIENQDNSVKISDFKERCSTAKSNSFENDFINSVAERRKEEEKYHNMKLNEINKERFLKNKEKAEKITEQNVNKIKDEAKLQDK